MHFLITNTRLVQLGRRYTESITTDKHIEMIVSQLKNNKLSFNNIKIEILRANSVLQSQDGVFQTNMFL